MNKELVGSMEVGNSSGAVSNEIWAKLVPSDPTICDVEIRLNEMIICSEISSCFAEKKEWCKITRNLNNHFATLLNTRSNVIFVDGLAVQCEGDVVIHCGSEIIPAPSKEGYITYKFKVTLPAQESLERNLKLKIHMDVEQAKCSICLNLWHDVVTVAPCLHNFCNGCFSEWLRRSQKKQCIVLCPQCRAVVQIVARNHFLRALEQDILHADSSSKRSEEEIALLDSLASVKSNLVLDGGKVVRRKRARQSIHEESDDLQFSCPQCATEFRDFQCNRHTAHLQCQTCGGMMPSRMDIGVPQHCLGCDGAFCGAYWYAQGITRSNTDVLCAPDSFKPIAERMAYAIPFLTHETNRHEQYITERSIMDMGRTLPDVISEWVGKLNNREIDRTNLPLKHAESVSAATYICNECYDKVVSFLLYWFRISLPRSLLPPEARDRQDCWYGNACRTQFHNEDHARKRNHVCRPKPGTSLQRLA